MKTTKTPSGQSEPNLKTLQEYYKNLVEEHKQLAEEARTQLFHVEALLSRDGKISLASTPAPAASPSKQPTEVAKPKPSSKPKATKASVEPVPAPRPKGRPKSTPVVDNGSSRQSSTIKLLKPYQQFTLIAAIEQVLLQYKGKAVSADEVVTILYGDLKPNLFKIAKERITKSLSKGKIEGRWDRVPNKQGMYTLALSAL